MHSSRNPVAETNLKNIIKILFYPSLKSIPPSPPPSSIKRSTTKYIGRRSAIQNTRHRPSNTSPYFIPRKKTKKTNLLHTHSPGFQITKTNHTPRSRNVPQIKTKLLYNKLLFTPHHFLAQPHYYYPIATSKGSSILTFYCHFPLHFPRKKARLVPVSHIRM